MRYKPDLHDLLHRVGKGDSLALEELDSEIRQPLTNFLYKQFSTSLSEDDIEDIIQYTLIQIWRIAPDYLGSNGNASAKSMINQIARHRALRLLKSYKHEMFSLNDSDDDSESGGNNLGSHLKNHNTSRNVTEDQALKKIIWQEVNSLIESLPEHEKTIFRLRMEQGLTMDEIGARVERSKPRVKQILDSILSKIRTYYRS